MLRHRLTYGPLMIALLAGLFYLDGLIDQISIQGTFLQTLTGGRTYLPAGLLMLLAFLILIPVGTKELRAIFQAKGIHTSRLMTSLAGMVGCALVYVVPHKWDSQKAVATVVTVMAVFFLVTLVKHSWRGRTQGAVAAAGATLFCLVYLGLFPGFYVAIRRWHSPWVVAGVILVVKSCDIGAYFTGRLIGRHKLIPWLSPGKTWEGLVGGVLVSGLVAMGLVALDNRLDLWGAYVPTVGPRQPVHHDHGVLAAGVVGVLFGLVGQFGDLCASLFKRDAGIKDSASYIPGFGGLIDVADSPVIVAPLAYWILVLAAGQ